MKKEPVPSEASPYKSVAQELEALQATFRTLCRQYGGRVDSEIARVRERVLAAGAVAAERVQGSGTQPRPATKGDPARRREAEMLAQIHDLRDMLTLLRTLEIKPDAGRRKDLKKIEGLVDDLRLLVSGWE